MDLAYDHIAEQSFATDRSQTPKPNDKSTVPTNADETTKPTLQTELQETFKAFSTSTWGSKLGGFWGNVRKQGESYYTEAKKEVGDLGADALKWSEGLRETVVAAGSNVGAATVIGRGRSGTLKPGIEDDGAVATREIGTVAAAAEEEGIQIQASQDATGGEVDEKDRALQENDTFIERFKAEAAKRLKEVQKAEDAADEALLRFGTNIRNFLKDAVSVSAPEAVAGNDAKEVLFESQDAATGRRVIHTSRFDAQLHVIHTTLTSFTRDPDVDGKEWAVWRDGFDVDKKTDSTAGDLDKYTELRNSMEKLVPEKVEYRDFWTRYYFLRHVVETQDEKRREMLKASADDEGEEEVGWDDDESEDETDSKANVKSSVKAVDHQSKETTSTLQQINTTPTTTNTTDNIHLKPAEARRSHDEKSVADSDASYDLVSGASSRAPGSPKDSKSKIEEESDEEDWE